MQRIKYPKTPHLAYSQGISSDDIVVKEDSLAGQKVVISEKMDGENTTLYNNDLHARSINNTSHISRNWIKNFHSRFSHLIPSSYRICGENLYAKHSIKYIELPTYFMVFSIWDDNKCLSWSETKKICMDLGLETVPILFEGMWNAEVVSRLISNLDLTKQEGLVVRNESEFSLEDFDKNICKWVRKNHVSTANHWMSSDVEVNLLKRI